MAKTKLKDLEVTEVSLVDAGANQHAHVALYKRNGGKPEEQPTGQNPEQAPAKSGLHKFFSAIGKALKLDQADIDSAVADIEKADTFNDKMEERKLRRITDEIWDVCFALENSLCSIIRDEEVTDKAALMNQSIDEFDVAIKGLVTSWGAGKTAQIVKTAGAVSVEHMQETVDRLGGMIEKATGKQQPPETEDPGQEGEDNGKTKTKKSIGGETDMKFNEANMTATDRMAFEELKKRYGVEDGAEGAGAGAGAAPAQPTTAKKYYRVRKTWTDAASQKGAFENYDNAKACADQNKGYKVFDWNGKQVYPAAAFRPYQVRVEITDLNIRTGPGTGYAKTQHIPVGTYTIVEEANGKGATKWGRLKSGAGWISLDYVKRV